jgi:hypothetical protein
MLVALLAAAIPACGGDPNQVALHPASGQVLYEGKALPDVQIIFRPAGADPTVVAAVPIGQTDSEGKFRLSTAVGEDGRLTDGAPEGDYLVGIVTPRRTDSVDILRKDGPKLTPDLLQGRFADPKTSGLKATIKPGENTLQPFDLKASGVVAAPVGSDGRGR